MATGKSRRGQQAALTLAITLVFTYSSTLPALFPACTFMLWQSSTHKDAAVLKYLKYPCRCRMWHLRIYIYIYIDTLVHAHMQHVTPPTCATPVCFRDTDAAQLWASFLSTPHRSRHSTAAFGVNESQASSWQMPGSTQSPAGIRRFLQHDMLEPTATWEPH